MASLLFWGRCDCVIILYTAGGYKSRFGVVAIPIYVQGETSVTSVANLQALKFTINQSLQNSEQTGKRTRAQTSAEGACCQMSNEKQLVSYLVPHSNKL